MRYEIGVGGLLLVAIAMTGVMALKIGALELGDTIDVSVPMSDAAGLDEGSEVSVAGVRVGSVGSMYLAGGLAMVTIHLDPRAALRQDAVARVRMESLLGTKYVELTPGSPDAPLLRDGDVLDPVGEQFEIDELLEALHPLLDVLEPEELSSGFAAVLQTLQEDPDRLDRMLTNLDTTLIHASSAAEDLPLLTADARLTLSSTRSMVEQIEARSVHAGQILTRADRLLGDLEAAAEPLPETISEAQLLVSEARDALASVQGATERLDEAMEMLKGFSPDEVERILQDEGIRVRLSGGRWDK
ncbi:MAG TPA: MCE family protein [Deltaproteobacteria bacterium]|nr:MCE family protein [Deltaproteobacteria bacterium]